MEEASFNEFILANMPYFIAVNYQRLLDTQSPQEQVKLILHIYNLGLRALTINLVSQYLIRNRDIIDDVYLSQLLWEKFRHLTTGAWKEIFFTTLKVYEGKQHLFFMPELHDFYWDTTVFPYRKRSEVKVPFDRLTQAALELELREDRFLPKDESSWLALAAELMGHLQHILRNLSFLSKYDLIRILDQDDDVYTFELHKGIDISTDQRPSPKHTKLTSGWFYLRAAGENFLPLNPWMLFWDRKPEENELVPPLIGVYDRMFLERLRYLLPTPGQTREDTQYLKEFIALIYDTIDEARSRRQEAEKLTWVQLCDICEKITHQRMATVQGKYQKELYLQRESVRQKLELFLADSEKRVFVLVGKSGVGKSNFLLAFGEELEQSRSDVAMLMYDGANLSLSSTSITAIIDQDFSDWVHLSGQPVQQIWQEINRIDGIQERLVIFCVDAINENREPTELLRQLDELAQRPWHWLKIVFTSRPETWRSIKRGVKLSEALYYHEQGSSNVEVELEGFSYSEQMEPFSRQELPEVYAKYQRKFHLQTSYESLSNELRETLRDPLNLWLLAHTYPEQAIPDTVKTSELIEHYVSTLPMRTLLQRKDLQFLENELIPLMVGRGHYSNVITAADLDEADGVVYNKVFSEDKLSDEQPMNISFLRLVDADILVQRSERQTAIQFKYERFYEYFVGKRIVQLSKEPSIDRSSFFEEMIEETVKTPFLWGAVRNALVQEAKERGPELLLKLCFTDQQRVKEMLVNVLVYLGVDEPAQVEAMLKRLMPVEKKATEVQKIRQMMSKSTEIADLRTRNARKIAIEVASHLKLGGILQTAALQPDATTRAVAVRYSYFLWKRDREAGFEVLEHLAQQAAAGLIPNFPAFESVFGLSLIIFCEYYQEKGVLSRLQGLWHTMIATLFRMQKGSDTRKGVVGDFIRQRIISFAINITFRLFGEFPGYNMVSPQALGTFFQLGTAEKALYRNLVHYLNVDGQYSREQMEHDYLAAIQINNVLLILTTAMGLVAHTCADPLAFLPFLRHLFKEAEKDVATYPYLFAISDGPMNALFRDPMNDELFDFFVYTIEVCQQRYAEHPETRYNRFAEAPQASGMHCYILTQYRREKTVRTPWLETRIQAALLANNLKFFDLLLTMELPQIAIEQQEPRAALAAVELFFSSDNEQVKKMIMTFLGRLRTHYPDEVDDFLEEQQAPDEFRLQVRTHESAERVGELIGMRTWYFIRDSVLLGPPELRSQFIDIFEKAAACKDSQAWVSYIFRRLVNLTYGSEALRQSK